MRRHLQFGSANQLDLTTIPDFRERPQFGLRDPRRIQAVLGISEINRRLFPFVRSGVRFWPYLLVARDLNETGKHGSAVLQKLRVLRRKQAQYRKEKHYKGRPFGPRTLVTFAPYQGLMTNIRESTDCDAQHIRTFLSDRRRGFNGNPKVFVRHQKEWQKCFVQANGKQGKDFAQLLRKYGNEDSAVDSAITELLTRTQFDELLRSAAFCYAFLRCVYGVGSRIEGIRSHVKGPDWAKKLHRLLNQTTPHALAKYRELLPLVIESKSVPALGRTAAKVREYGGSVLAGLGFHVFFNLYSRQMTVLPQP